VSSTWTTAALPAVELASSEPLDDEQPAISARLVAATAGTVKARRFEAVSM
jgi:hypothetical protein